VQATGKYFAARIAGFFGAMFLVYGAAVPYLPVLLDARGLNASEIGLISSLPLMLRLVLTPAIALHADRRGDHRSMLIWLAVAAVAAVGLVAHVGGFWPLLVCVVAFQLALQSMMPLIETIAMAGVKQLGHDYGRMRLSGSVTFILATFVGAWLIDWRGAEIVGAMLLASTVVTLGSALLLPGPMPCDDTAPRARPDVGTALRLMAEPRVILFLVAAGAIQSAHAVFYAFGVLHWRASAIPSTWIGSLWSVGVLAEIALFWWSGAALRRLSAVDLIVIGAAAGVLRWTLMAFDPPLAALVPLQILHGLTYGASHLGAMHFIKARVPDANAGTAQALYSTVTAGIGMGLAMILAGYTYRYFGGLSYLAMAVLAAVSLVAAITLRRMGPAITGGG